MIRQLKNAETVHYIVHGRLKNFVVTSSGINYSVFVNDNNFLHNDVGPAFEEENKYKSWWWNGHLIK